MKPPDGSMALQDWVRSEVEAQPYWFHRIELAPDLVTPGWNDARASKLPFFRLPEDMTGMRVLDIGCCEGFFSFEAERRGASEVVAIDWAPDAIRRFDLCRSALGSRVHGYLANVYDLSPGTFGTFDLVMFFGVLYHLRHPLLALEKVFEVCSGELRIQSYTFEDSERAESAALFHPFGVMSGPAENPMHDPTVLWVPNAACVRDMLLHIGFTDVEGGPTPAAAVFSAAVPERRRGTRPSLSMTLSS